MTQRHADPMPRMERVHRRPSHADLLAGMLGAIGAAPDLPGALCKGSTDWDADHDGRRESADARGERLARAAETCRRCPALEACGSWLDGLPRHRRPTGVVAGVVIGTPRCPPTREPKREPRPRPEPAPRGPTRTEQCREWIAEYLYPRGRTPVGEVLAAAAAAGLARGLVYRAADGLVAATGSVTAPLGSAGRPHWGLAELDERGSA